MDRFEDARGSIQDLLDGPIDAVTEIYTVAGAVRGNHVHQFTIQWTYIVSGRMLFAAGEKQMEHSTGALIRESAGVPHAWKAVEDTTVLVFTRGPRSGSAYETDTKRLDVPLLT